MNARSAPRWWIFWLWASLCTWSVVIMCLAPGGRGVLQGVADAAAVFRSELMLVNTSTPMWRVVAPAGILALGLVLVMTLCPKPARPLRAAVILLLVCLATIYMIFRACATLNLDSPAEAGFSLAFFAAEGVIYLKSMSAYLQMFWPTERSAQADRLMDEVLQGRYVPSVDIFVPTYGEPVDILRRTLLGCQSLNYPRKDIYLLDDQRRPEMRQLALELQCHYCDRPDNRDAKAGNMNAALPRSAGELIAVFDADFIPTADFLQRTVGFFQDPNMGLVQTPQNFYSVDAVTRNLGLPNVLTEEQQVFFRSAQPGRDTMGAVICHGTSFVVRRTAVQEIGGFPGETLSEDWATSIKLQAAGWRTCYLNELLSAGTAADFISEFVTQRLRWARGTLQTFFASTNPLTVPGLTWLQRVVHLSGPLHYVQYLCRLFCLLLPLLYFAFGIVPISVSGELLLFYLLPYWVCQTLTQSWLTGGHRSAFWSEVYETLLCVPMAGTVVSTLWRPFGKPFKVSSKGQTRSRLAFNGFVSAPLLVLLAAYVLALVYAVYNADWYPSRSIFSLAVGWSVYSMVLLWLAFQATLDVPMPSAVLRFPYQLPSQITCHGISHHVTIEELSDVDAILTVPHLAEGLPPTCTVQLALPIEGLQDILISGVEAAGPDRWRVEWPRLPLEQHRKFISFLYGRPGQWDDEGVPEHVTFWHFLQAPFRMFPLAEGESAKGDMKG